MATLTELLPMPLLFVIVFGVLPLIVTVYDTGIKNMTKTEWASFVIILTGVLAVYAVSSMQTSVEMQRFLWPLLAVVAFGLLLYRRTLEKKGEWDASDIERGGTSYDD